MVTKDLIPYVALAVAAFFGSAFVTRSARSRGRIFIEPLTAFTYILLPTLFALAAGLLSGQIAPDGWWARILKSLVGIEIIWVLLSLLKSIFLWRASTAADGSRLPVLFLDVVRLTLVVLGSAFVIAAVWNRDLTQFLTTLGIGSIVLGLALQETLGNFFSGIALFFERPFNVGDWIRIGDREGEVIEANWRSVRIRDRGEAMVVIPNSVLGRERIENFSQPTKVCAVTAQIGFSYDDPPNVVKNVLLEVLRDSPGVLAHPAPSVRTKSFADSAITYDIKYFIDDYEQVPEIDEEMKTRIWYAARRHSLTIPYPIRVVYKTEMPAESKKHAPHPQAALARVPLFQPLSGDELAILAADTSIAEYGDGESVVEQGAPGDCMFLVHKGHAAVSIKDESGERHVKRLGPGDFFGEMGLLTGEPRSATVRAEGDLQLLVVHKQPLNTIFAARPGLLTLIAEVASARRSNLEVIRTTIANAPRSLPNQASGALVARIRNFFGMIA